MSKVFVPQEPAMKRPDGNWVTKGYNIAAASSFGDIVIIWPPGTSSFAMAMNTRKAKEIADQYDDAEDHIVAVGSPTLMMMLSYAIGAKGKKLNILEWDKGMGTYYSTTGITNGG